MVDRCKLRTALLIAALAAAGTLATQARVSSNQNGAKAGDEVTFTCSFDGQSLAFGDAIEWGRVNESAFDLITTNLVVEPSWRNLVTATLSDNQLSITLKVFFVSQTGAYRCRLRRGLCTPSPATTCVTTLGEAPLKVYGSVTSVAWLDAENGTLTATVDADTELKYAIVATSDVSEYIQTYLGPNEITNDFTYDRAQDGDQWRITGSGSYKFTTADDQAILKVEVSVPLHSKSSDSVKLAVRTHPAVDCPEAVSAILGDAAHILCVVTSSLPLTSIEWVSGGEPPLTIRADGGESDGLTSSLTKTSESSYNVDLRTSAMAKSHVRAFQLVAVNEVGRRTDEVAFHEALPPAKPEKAVSERQPTGSNEATRPATGAVGPAVLACILSSLAALLWS